MTGETESDVSAFTTDSLRVLHDQAIVYEARIAAQGLVYERQLSDERDRRYQERWVAQEKASERAQAIGNEFRGALSDLSTQMATKDELAVALGNMNEKFDRVFAELSNVRSRLDVGNPDVRALQQGAAAQFGHAEGANVTRAVFFAAIAAMGTVIGIVVVVANVLAK